MKIIDRGFITPGKKIRLFYNKDNKNNKLFHIIAIVDIDYVVVKRWLKYQQYWYYEVKHMGWFEMNKDILYKIY